MRYEEVQPDMQVTAPGMERSKVAVVLHKRPAPAGEAADAVFVYWWLNGEGCGWISAAELEWRGDMPSLPVVMDVADGTEKNAHDRTFWFMGREFRVASMWRDGTGERKVEHVAEDGTRSMVLDGQRCEHKDAAVNAAKAMSAMRGMTETPVEYVVMAQDRDVHDLRMEHPEADEHGRLHVESPAEAAPKIAGVTKGIRRDRLSGKETRRAVYQFSLYPVFADGWIGLPSLHRLDNS